eukprot:119493_1
MEGEWHFTIAPNGFSTEGIGHLQITCNSIESGQEELILSYYVEIMSLNHSQNNFDGNTFKKGKALKLKSPFKHKDIKNASSITIGIKLWANEWIDKVESQFLSALYSQSPKEWREYFITRTNRVTTLLFAVGMQQYAAVFKDNEYKTIHHLRDLSHMDLEEIGVS